MRPPPPPENIIAIPTTIPMLAAATPPARIRASAQANGKDSAVYSGVKYQADTDIGCFHTNTREKNRKDIGNRPWQSPVTLAAWVRRAATRRQTTGRRNQ